MKTPKVTIKLIATDQNPYGLFQTHLKAGLLFAIMGNELQSYPTFNDCRGENVALNLMHDPTFTGWAIDPWTSEIM